MTYAAPVVTQAAPVYAAPQPVTYAAPQTMSYAAPTYGAPQMYAAPQGYAQPTFNQLDRNHDGVLDRAEFNAAMGM